MKLTRILSLLLSVLVFFILVFFDSCSNKKAEDKPGDKPVEKIDYTFSGKVTTTKGEPVEGASVSVNGKEKRSDKEGNFSIVSEKNNRYVVNVKKRGYGLVSKIFHSPQRDHNIKLRRAFVATIDPTKNNVVHDNVSAETCTGNTTFQNLAFDKEYKKIPFVYDNEGNLTDFGWTGSGNKAVFDLLTGPPICNPGATVTIPANTIVDENGRPAKDTLTISISTVDLLSEDGMPGDYTLQINNDVARMISMGAVSVELYSGERSFNLDRKSKLKTKLAMPVDPTKLRLKVKIPETIPVLYYDDTTGYWEQEGKHMARLNRKTNVYETELEHFSSINLDLVETGGVTCYKFRQDAGGDPALVKSPYVLYGMTPGLSYFTTHSGSEDPPECIPKGGANMHPLFLGPKPGSELCVVLAIPGTPPSAFYGIAIVTAGSAYSNNSADANYVDVYNCPDDGTTASPCYDTSTSMADENVSTCMPLCTSIPIKLFPPSQNAILAAKEIGPGAAGKKRIRLRWIFQAPTSASSYTYTIFSKDGFATTFDELPKNSSPGPGEYSGDGTYSPSPGFNPVTTVEVDVPDNGADTDVYVRVDEGGGVVPYNSQVVRTPNI